MTECFLCGPNILKKLARPHISRVDMLLSLLVNAFHSSERMSLFHCWYLKRTYMFDDPISLKGYAPRSVPSPSTQLRQAIFSKELHVVLAQKLRIVHSCGLFSNWREAMQWEKQCNTWKDPACCWKGITQQWPLWGGWEVTAVRRQACHSSHTGKNKHVCTQL